MKNVDLLFLHKKPVILWNSASHPSKKNSGHDLNFLLRIQENYIPLHIGYICRDMYIRTWSCQFMGSLLSSIVFGRPTGALAPLLDLEWNIQWPLFICMYSDHISLGVVVVLHCSCDLTSTCLPSKCCWAQPCCLLGTTSNTTIIIP